MRNYITIPHTADIRLLVEGDTLQELFGAALEGMNAIIKRGFCQTEKELLIKHTISLSSFDMTSLLIDFLSEVLTYSQTDDAIFCKVVFEKLSKKSLKATIFGTTTDSFDEDIKAVTYHEAQVKKNSEGNYETVIVFDI